jgi:glutathione S-transferase
MSALKLYYHPWSTFSQRVRIALLEKEIPADLIEVDLPGNLRPRDLRRRCCPPVRMIVAGSPCT